jgi:hypothetical protein
VVAAWVAMARHITGTSGRWPVWGAFGCGLAAGSLAGRWSAAVTLFAVTAGLGLVLAASVTVRAAVRERTPLAFYSFATIILWLLCLGPNGRRALWPRRP